jgi:hypothetical protein
MDERLKEVLRRVMPKLVMDPSSNLQQLLEPGVQAECAEVLAAWAGGHSHGAGLIIDALITASPLIRDPRTIMDAAEHMYNALQITGNALNEWDLDQAAQRLQWAISLIGADAFVAIIRRGLDRVYSVSAKSDGLRRPPPPVRPPPQRAPQKRPTSPAAPLGRGSVAAQGTAAEQKTLDDLVEKIRKSGPKGKAFIEALEKGPTKTRLFVAKSATKKDGTVVSLASLGGGVTLRPSESKSGDNEVYVDPTNLINYTATDGTAVKETPEGLLLHEMGHAKLLNDGDAAQTKGGAKAEENVRKETNPIRQELGMKPEK